MCQQPHDVAAPVGGAPSDGSSADAMQALSAALDALAAQELTGLGVGVDLAERMAQLQRLTNRLQAEVLRTTAAFDASGVWDADGAVSSAAWMRGRLQVAAGAARQQVTTARALRDHLPHTSAALAEGRVHAGHLRVLVGSCLTNQARIEALGESEHLLVEAAESLDPQRLRRVVDHWANRVDARGAVAEALKIHDERHLNASTTFEGQVIVDGTLDREGGAILTTALEAVGTLIREPQDERRPGQLRADALVELCRMVLNHGDLLGLPAVAGQRPHISLTIPAAVAGGSSTGGAELDRAGAVTADAALRLLCDASVLPIIVDEAGRPLDVGRTRRTVPAHLRRAVAQRDQHCTFAGCDRPANWCEAHHIVPWSHGGATSLDNLTLLCVRHHHHIHDRGFSLQGRPGHDLRTIRPDGTTIPNSRPVNRQLLNLARC
jgi:hypothetical protein